MNTDSKLWLTPAEVERRTKRKTAKAQIRVLIAKRVKFTTNGDGEPLILRSVIDEENGISSITEQVVMPDVEGLRNMV